MRLAVLIAILLCSGHAAADLYRWVDPETGSVKFSSYPPPWYGDPALERSAPKVELIPSRAETPARPGEPTSARNAGSAKEEGGFAQDAARAMEIVNERRRALIASLAALPSSQDFDRAGAGIRQQVEAYEALSAELDRIDPKGAERRRAEARPVLARIAEGLRAQFSPASPVRGAAK